MSRSMKRSRLLAMIRQAALEFACRGRPAFLGMLPSGHLEALRVHHLHAMLAQDFFGEFARESKCFIKVKRVRSGNRSSFVEMPLHFPLAAMKRLLKLLLFCQDNPENIVPSFRKLRIC